MPEGKHWEDECVVSSDSTASAEHVLLHFQLHCAVPQCSAGWGRAGAYLAMKQSGKENTLENMGIDHLDTGREKKKKREIKENDKNRKKD